MYMCIYIYIYIYMTPSMPTVSGGGGFPGRPAATDKIGTPDPN